MKVRYAQPEDYAAVRALHAAQGLNYELPELDSPLVLLKMVLEDDAGRITAAVLARLTCEAYLVADRSSGTPLSRWQGILALHQVAMAEGWRRGLDDAHCWLPPKLARSFGKRLEWLGWQRPKWTSFALALREPSYAGASDGTPSYAEALEGRPAGGYSAT